jgi:hypothetical protein
MSVLVAVGDILMSHVAPAKYESTKSTKVPVRDIRSTGTTYSTWYVVGTPLLLRVGLWDFTKVQWRMQQAASAKEQHLVRAGIN